MCKIAPGGICLLSLCCVLTQRSGICINKLRFRFTRSCYLRWRLPKHDLWCDETHSHSEASNCARGKDWWRQIYQGTLFGVLLNRWLRKKGWFPMERWFACLVPIVTSWDVKARTWEWKPVGYQWKSFTFRRIRAEFAEDNMCTLEMNSQIVTSIRRCLHCGELRPNGMNEYWQSIIAANRC